MLKLFNSLSSTIEDFEPFEKNLVRIVICGPTVYDYSHLGHARIFLTYDLLCRHLQNRGYKTDVLVNITDINKSLFNRAKEEGKDYKTLAQFYLSKFVEDLNSLNVRTVNRLCCVSDYLDSIVKEISILMEKKIAYIARGNVYLDTSKIDTYGRLSKQSREDLRLHRLDIGPNKKNQEDIMLWNSADDFGISFESKFGRGIPWWHIQDTAVAMDNFGSNYDIHGGATELAYPHHESHLVQYSVLGGVDNPVKIWMHIGLVQVKGEKMSKSLGNVLWSRDLVERYGQNLLRLYLFCTHYRSDVEFREEDLDAKKELLEKILVAVMKTSDRTDDTISGLIKEFYQYLDNDLDSPRAIDTLERICTDVINGSAITKKDFQELCQTLGLRV